MGTACARCRPGGLKTLATSHAQRSPRLRAGATPASRRVAAVTRGRLRTAAPFHLEATVRVLQRRPENRVDRWEHDRYWRLLEAPDGLVLIEVQNQGTIDKPDVRYAVCWGWMSIQILFGILPARNESFALPLWRFAACGRPDSRGYLRLLQTWCRSSN